MPERYYVTPGFDPTNTTVTDSTLASEMFLPTSPVGETLTAFWQEHHFSHGSTAETFVGQEHVRAQVGEFIETAQPGDIALVVGPFGTGKTSAVNLAIDEAVARGTINKDGATTAFATGGFPELDTSVQLLRIDEFGRTTSEGEVEDVISFVRSLRANREAGTLPPAIITGDSTLDDERFFEVLGLRRDEVKRVEMEPVTPALVLEAFRRQLRQIHIHKAMGSIEGLVDKPFTIEDATAQADAIFSEQAVSSLFDEGFLQHVAELIDPPSVSVRDALMVLQGTLRLGSDLQSNERPFRFNGEWYKEYRKRQLGEDPLEQSGDRTRQVASWLQATIRKGWEEGRPFQAVSMAEMLGSVFGEERLKPIRVRLLRDELEDKGYIKRAVSSDFYTAEERLYSTRFVPKPKFFLDTYYSAY